MRASTGKLRCCVLMQAVRDSRDFARIQERLRGHAARSDDGGDSSVAASVIRLVKTLVTIQTIRPADASSIRRHVTRMSPSSMVACR